LYYVGQIQTESHYVENVNARGTRAWDRKECKIDMKTTNIAVALAVIAIVAAGLIVVPNIGLGFREERRRG
jgi:hypothetical protein